MENLIITLLVGIILGMIIFRQPFSSYGGMGTVITERNNNIAGIVTAVLLILLGIVLVTAYLEEKPVIKEDANKLFTPKKTEPLPEDLFLDEILRDTTELIQSDSTHYKGDEDPHEVTPEEEPFFILAYSVQLGAFREKENADMLLEAIKTDYQDEEAFIIEVTDDNGTSLYKVCLGVFAEEKEAEEFGKELHQDFVVIATEIYFS